MKSGARQARSLRKRPGSFHHGDLREAALVAATQVVERSGAELLSVRSIAHALGVSDAAIYRHFSSREALLREIGLRGVGECMQAVIVAMHDVHDPADRLLAAGRAYLRHAVEHQGWYRLFASRGFQEDAWTDVELLTELAARGPVSDEVFEQAIAAAPKPVRNAALAEREMKRALAHLVPRDSIDDHYRVLWSLAHGFAGLVIDRLFRRCKDDEERMAAADRGLMLHIDLVRKCSAT
jgi:AcrR family transcriptional regulator